MEYKNINKGRRKTTQDLNPVKSPNLKVYRVTSTPTYDHKYIYIFFNIIFRLQVS